MTFKLSLVVGSCVVLLLLLQGSQIQGKVLSPNTEETSPIGPFKEEQYYNEQKDLGHKTADDQEEADDSEEEADGTDLNSDDLARIADKIKKHAQFLKNKEEGKPVDLSEQDKDDHENVLHVASALRDVIDDK